MKMKVKKAIILLCLSFLFVSCYQTKYVYEVTPIEDILKQYKGMTKNQITKEFGPPDRVTGDGARGEIYIYENNKYVTNTFVMTYDNWGTGNSTTYEKTQYLQLYFNEYNKVYYYRTNYPDKVVEYSDGKEFDKETTALTIGGIALIILVTFLQGGAYGWW